MDNRGEKGERGEGEGGGRRGGGGGGGEEGEGEGGLECVSGLVGCAVAVCVVGCYLFFVFVALPALCVPLFRSGNSMWVEATRGWSHGSSLQESLLRTKDYMPIIIKIRRPLSNW